MRALALVAAVWLLPQMAAAAGGAFERERSTHFLLLYDVEFEGRTGRDGSARFERAVLQSLEASYRGLDDLLGVSPRRRIDVVVHDRRRFDRDLAWRFRFPSAGFYAERIHVRGGGRVDSRLEAVLAHELVHAAFDQAAPSLQLPGWFNEGIARWFEARRHGKRGFSVYERSALIGAGRHGAWLDLEALSTPSFARFDQSHAARAYLQSYGMVEHLVERRGERALREWIRRSLRSGDTSSALHRAAGLEPAELERSLRASLGL